MGTGDDSRKAALEALDEIDSALRVALQHMSPDQPNIRSGLVEAVRKAREVRAALAERSEREREAFERGFAAGLREGKGNKCAQCNGHGTIQRGYGPARCDACDGKGY